jgi:hypothetical protein
MVPGLDKLDKTDATVVSDAALLIIAEAIFVGSRKQVRYSAEIRIKITGS